MRERKEKRIQGARARRAKSTNLWYILLNSLFSTVYFILAFQFIIQPNYVGAEKTWGFFMPVDYLFFLIIYSVVTSILGSWTARLITRNNRIHSLKAYTENIFYSILYALLIYFGILSIIFMEDNWMNIFINLLALKIFVSLLANVISSKVVGLS